MQRPMAAILMCMCRGFPAGRLEQMIVTSGNDVMRISHAIEGGTIKGEQNQTSGLSSGSFDTKHLGLLTMSQTLYFG